MIKFIGNNEEFEKLKKYGFSNNWSGTKNWCANFGIKTFVEIDINTCEVKVSVDSDYESSVDLSSEDMDMLCDFFNSDLLAKVKKASEWTDKEMEDILWEQWGMDLIRWERTEEGNIKVETYSEDYTIGNDEEVYWIYANQRRIRKH